MWLAETAVDIETLEIMAENGILFTILAPHQARRVRGLKEEKWKDVSGGAVDPKMPYQCRLPSGRAIAIFFYDGPVSQDVAFGGLLRSGENFASRLIGLFSDKESPQLVHIATDGESYGHHHRFGEMALSYALHTIESGKLARITNYGEYLELNPPSHQVEIFENTSWSCAHGIERWRSNCGCNTGAHPGWTQAWRGPLREAMNMLGDALAALYEREMSRYAGDPWQARNDYISVVLDRSVGNIDSFLSHHVSKKLSKDTRIKLLKLFEMQRDSLLMFAS
jgi:alpha-amylase/alpha-mannosidase (GH57 family)